MNVVLNPFSIGAGTPPPASVGRKDLLEKAYVAVERVRALRSEKSLLLVGLRGRRVGVSACRRDFLCLNRRCGVWKRRFATGE